MGANIKQLIDPFGRKVKKLRVSLTDKCNLRCHYCMPLDATFMDEAKYLSPAQYFQVIEELCAYGLEEIRLTGGEPLMRKSFPLIAAEFAKLPLRKIGMTTNAILLDRHLETLKKCGINFLNISLDSLDARTFHRITHGDHLPRVLKNIELAKAAGFTIKLNVVAMKGINDHEFVDLIQYAKKLDIEIRFLELMRIGFACGTQKDQFVSAKEIIESLKTRYQLVPRKMSADSTSFNFESTCGARVGFIASESQAFCGNCSRWRLSADGMLRACLMKDDGLSIQRTTAEERDEVYYALLGMKPAVRPLEVLHQMNAIGG
jgi:cyclic pyranopterin phosphate synthase